MFSAYIWLNQLTSSRHAFITSVIRRHPVHGWCCRPAPPFTPKLLSKMTNLPQYQPSPVCKERTRLQHDHPTIHAVFCSPWLVLTPEVCSRLAMVDYFSLSTIECFAYFKLHSKMSRWNRTKHWSYPNLQHGTAYNIFTMCLYMLR